MLPSESPDNPPSRPRRVPPPLPAPPPLLASPSLPAPLPRPARTLQSRWGYGGVENPSLTHFGVQYHPHPDGEVPTLPLPHSDPLPVHLNARERQEVVAYRDHISHQTTGKVCTMPISIGGMGAVTDEYQFTPGVGIHHTYDIPNAVIQIIDRSNGKTYTDIQHMHIQGLPIGLGDRPPIQSVPLTEKEIGEIVRQPVVDHWTSIVTDRPPPFSTTIPYVAHVNKDDLGKPLQCPPTPECLKGAREEVPLRILQHGQRLIARYAGDPSSSSNPASISIPPHPDLPSRFQPGAPLDPAFQWHYPEDEVPTEPEDEEDEDRDEEVAAPAAELAEPVAASSAEPADGDEDELEYADSSDAGDSDADTEHADPMSNYQVGDSGVDRWADETEAESDGESSAVASAEGDGEEDESVASANGEGDNDESDVGANSEDIRSVASAEDEENDESAASEGEHPEEEADLSDFFQPSAFVTGSEESTDEALERAYRESAGDTVSQHQHDSGPRPPRLRSRAEVEKNTSKWVGFLGKAERPPDIDDQLARTDTPHPYHYHGKPRAEVLIVPKRPRPDLPHEPVFQRLLAREISADGSRTSIPSPIRALLSKLRTTRAGKLTLKENPSPAMTPDSTTKDPNDTTQPSSDSSSLVDDVPPYDRPLCSRCLKSGHPRELCKETMDGKYVLYASDSASTSDKNEAQGDDRLVAIPPPRAVLPKLFRHDPPANPALDGPTSAFSTDDNLDFCSTNGDATDVEATPRSASTVPSTSWVVPFEDEDVEQPTPRVSEVPSWADSDDSTPSSTHTSLRVMCSEDTSESEDLSTALVLYRRPADVSEAIPDDILTGCAPLLARFNLEVRRLLAQRGASRLLDADERSNELVHLCDNTRNVLVARLARNTPYVTLLKNPYEIYCDLHGHLAHARLHLCEETLAEMHAEDDICHEHINDIPLNSPTLLNTFHAVCASAEDMQWHRWFSFMFPELPRSHSSPVPVILPSEKDIFRVSEEAAPQASPLPAPLGPVAPFNPAIDSLRAKWGTFANNRYTNIYDGRVAFYRVVSDAYDFMVARSLEDDVRALLWPMDDKRGSGNPYLFNEEAVFLIAFAKVYGEQEVIENTLTGRRGVSMHADARDLRCLVLRELPCSGNLIRGWLRGNYLGGPHRGAAMLVRSELGLREGGPRWV
ncbi:hypothetical protein EV715DRAFT_297979 [Schizophyllum commune]